CRQRPVTGMAAASGEVGGKKPGRECIFNVVLRVFRRALWEHVGYGALAFTAPGLPDSREGLGAIEAGHRRSPSPFAGTTARTRGGSASDFQFKVRAVG